jgi:hypothetical protein
VDDLLRGLNGYEKPDQGVVGDHFTLELEAPQYQAIINALRWAIQNIDDFDLKPSCLMCKTSVATIKDVLCNYHLRLKTSGLACVWRYDAAREFFCSDRVYKDNLCERHYAGKQKETPETRHDEAVKMRA